MAGQIVMSGFLKLRIRPILRRLFTRLVAIVPAMITVLMYGDRGLNSLLILSQVVLSCQLPFAIIPLVYFTSSREIMGDGSPISECGPVRNRRGLGSHFANGWILTILAWASTVLVSGLNIWLVVAAIVESLG
jgi:manganese transport protein